MADIERRADVFAKLLLVIEIFLWSKPGKFDEDSTAMMASLQD